jgi:hypothetical protein
MTVRSIQNEIGPDHPKSTGPHSDGLSRSPLPQLLETPGQQPDSQFFTVPDVYRMSVTMSRYFYQSGYMASEYIL